MNSQYEPEDYEEPAYSSYREFLDSRAGSTIGAIILSVVSAIFVILGILFYIGNSNALNLLNWIETTGILIDYDVDEFDGKTMYEPIYQYTVDGIGYKVSGGEFLSSRNSDNIVVIYNPDNPKEAVPKRENNSQNITDIVLISFACLLLVLSIIILVRNAIIKYKHFDIFGLKKKSELEPKHFDLYSYLRIKSEDKDETTDK